MKSIKAKLTITALGSFIIVSIMFLETWWISGLQKNDGLVINLAGRQRMLSQKLTKEIVFYNSLLKKKTPSDLSSLKAQIRTTMKVFDITLSALKDSGNAPISLDLSTTSYRYCPRSKEPAYAQLQKVEHVWKRFMKHVETNLSSHNVNLDWIMNNNMILLKEMNKAVGMMQKQSESKIALLLLLQFCGILTAIVFVLFSIFTVKTIVSKLDIISQFARKFGSGDLTAKANIQGTDELGKIGQELNNMATQLRQMFVDINQSANYLESSANQFYQISNELNEKLAHISENASQVTGTANDTSQNMISVAAAMEEISSGINNMESSSEFITNKIEEVSKLVSDARKTTTNAVSESKSSSKQVSELRQAAKEIGSVTDDIRDISGQTNLLALNATIESARAGEAGRGFAVVANEVKVLSAQTSGATGHIQKRISTIQNVTDRTVHQIQQISSVVENISQIVELIFESSEEEGKALKEITANIIQSSQAVSEINEKINLSSHATQSTASDVSHINTATIELSEKSIEVKKNAADLKKQADQLKKIVLNFTV